MAEMRESWREVATRAEALGLKLRLHLEQEEGHAAASDAEAADSDQPPPPGSTGTTRAAIDDLGNKLKDAFESFGTAAKDPAVRSDVSDIGLLLKDALVATFTAVSADVGEAVKDVTGAVKKAGNRTPTDTPSDDAPPTDTVTPDEA